MKTVNIYTDGACRGNPGVGGWGALIEYENHNKEIFGGEKLTTNNQMELMAAIQGLKALSEKCNVNLTTDSKYVMDGINSWIKNWKRNNWKNSQKQNVKNKDLWIQLDKLNEQHDVKWHWVKGH
ncbi:MAG: ribonuclease HI, partial [SAR86 cluster bacterium]|nr:ribonuclease HI [SAR86 cluster bacterium]